VGQSVRFKFRPWKRVVHLVKAGKGAGMFSCVHTKEREQYLLFSDPISAVTRSFAVNKEYTGAEIKRFADVSSLKVVVVSGYATEKELANANIAYEAVINDKVALNLLFFRNFDAFYTTKEAMLWKTKEAGNGDKIRFFDIGQSQTNYHLCLGKNWPGVNGLLVSFNEGLAQIKANGVLDAIHAKYR